MASAVHLRRGWIIAGVVLLCALIAGGISLIMTDSAKTTPTASASPAADVVTPPAMHEGADEATADVRVDIYADYKCIWCARFEQTNGPTLSAGIADGTLSVTTHPVAILGGEGSFSHAAGATAGCVVETDPSSFGAWNAAMFAAQGPTEEVELSPAAMIALARDGGHSDTTASELCRFRTLPAVDRRDPGPGPYRHAARAGRSAGGYADRAHQRCPLRGLSGRRHGIRERPARGTVTAVLPFSVATGHGPGSPAYPDRRKPDRPAEWERYVWI